MKRWILIVSAVMLMAGVAAADEGMWLFNVPPTAKVKAKYGFDLTKAWLDHTQLSSVRFNNGGSGHSSPRMASPSPIITSARPASRNFPPAARTT